VKTVNKTREEKKTIDNDFQLKRTKKPLTVSKKLLYSTKANIEGESFG
jgi:hypothetical protein